DFEGQRQVDILARASLVAVSFLVGLAVQSLQATFAVFGAGAILLLLITVPPWPMFNKHPVQWLIAKKTDAKPSNT
ncbi:microsomal signal peptidase 12kDa subunit, partial [Cytidiella melzeri]